MSFYAVLYVYEYIYVQYVTKNKQSFIFPINPTILSIFGPTIYCINNRSCREKRPSIKDLAKMYFNEYGDVVLPSVEKI